MGITRRYKDTTLEHELTKPCPLMPDGEWYRSTLHMYYEDGELKYEVSHSSDNIPYDISLNLGTTACAASVMINADCTTTHKLAECRMTFETTGTLLANMAMQASYGWRVDSETNRQRYYLFYYASNPFSYYIADGDTYYDVYVYVVPCEYQNND